MKRYGAYEQVNGAVVNDLLDKVMVLQKGIQAVRNLIDESGGVFGLHLNGDDAPWGELEEGGRFEDWLVDFNKAEDI